MDFLQIAIILTLIILTVFLSIAGLQVFYILKDLQRALKKLNQVIYQEEAVPAGRQEKVAEKISGASLRVKQSIKRPVNKHPRFFKKTL